MKPRVVAERKEFMVRKLPSLTPAKTESMVKKREAFSIQLRNQQRQRILHTKRRRLELSKQLVENKLE